MIPHIIFILLSFLFIRTAWLRGGTPGWSQGHLLWGGLLLLLMLFPGAARKYGNWKKGVRRLIRDPITWGGAFFLILLTLQWWNAGRLVFFNPISGNLAYTPPRIPWLTSAIIKDEALEMLRWFIPAVAILLVLRHTLSRLAIRTLLQLLVVNGAILSAFGIVQYIKGADSIYQQVLPEHFFATFGYPNHAGAYFLLIASLSLGCVFRALEKNKKNSSVSGLVLWGGCFVFSFFGTILSLSRAAMVLSIGLLIIAGIVLFFRFWPDLRPVQRLNIFLALGAFTCVCYFVYDAFADQAIKSQWGIGENAEKWKYGNREIEDTGGNAEKRKYGNDETKGAEGRGQRSGLGEQKNRKNTEMLAGRSRLEQETSPSHLPPSHNSAPGSEKFQNSRFSYFQHLKETPLFAELKETRSLGRQAAVGIWREYPWFGCGGWGYRHLLITKLKPADRKIVKMAGQANTHCDPLQFLAEFGIVGTGLMLVIIVSLLFAALKAKVWRRPASIPILTGVTMVFAHSLVDLPFRCPAILHTWLFALAALPAMAGRRNGKV